MSMKINLLDFDRTALEQFFLDLGERSYRAKQVLKWIHQKKVIELAEMTDLKQDLRERLQQCVQINLPKVVHVQHSHDGSIKWLLQLDQGNCIETVFIPERTRGTVCISSQVGCTLNCRFCATGKQGFNRNLTTAEIISQLWIVDQYLSQPENSHHGRVSNVVMMGMGEPLFNFDNVVAALNLMLDDDAYGLSKYRVTLSTAGVIPAMEKLSVISPVSLAVSLHAPDDILRSQLVPLNKKYSIKPLIKCCKSYFSNEPKRKVTFEYVMLDGVNDSEAHAKALSKLLANVPAKVNLIPFNPYSGIQYRCSSPDKMRRFQDLLTKKGVHTIVRRTRGDDINAACGTLAGKVIDHTKRAQRWQNLIENK